jgi:hypothetical protein
MTTVDSESELIMCFSRNITKNFSQLLLVLPTQQVVPVTHASFLQTRYQNFIIFSCTVDKTHAYMHYHIHSIASYTNELFLVASLPHTEVPAERCATVPKTLIYRFCWTLSAGFMLVHWRGSWRWLPNHTVDIFKHDKDGFFSQPSTSTSLNLDCPWKTKKIIRKPRV